MNPYLISAIEFGPAVVRRIVNLIPADRLDEAIEPDRFTPREVIAHLADWEPIDRDRLTSGVEMPGSTIQPYAEAQMAVDHDYAHSNLASELERYTNERKITAEYMRRLTSEDMAKSVNHPERGIQTVSDLCGVILGHDVYHIEQLSAYLE